MSENTRNLADFGYRELEELRDILTAWIDNGLPDDFDDDGVVPEFNPNSGNVFLTNDEYQVAMLNGDVLESWYWLSYEGHEGFLDDLIDEADSSWHPDDLNELADICENNGRDEDAERIRALIEEDEDEDEEE